MSLISHSKRKKFFFEFEDKVKLKEKFRSPGSRTLVDILGTYDLCFVDFIKEIIVWDGKNRLTAEAALNHPWLLKNYSKTTRKNIKESFLRSEILLKKF